VPVRGDEAEAFGIDRGDRSRLHLLRAV
jgi:hypothetical protein